MQQLLPLEKAELVPVSAKDKVESGQEQGPGRPPCSAGSLLTDKEGVKFV